MRLHSTPQKTPLGGVLWHGPVSYFLASKGAFLYKKVACTPLYSIACLGCLLRGYNARRTEALESAAAARKEATRVHHTGDAADPAAAVTPRTALASVATLPPDRVVVPVGDCVDVVVADVDHDLRCGSLERRIALVFQHRLALYNPGGSLHLRRHCRLVSRHTEQLVHAPPRPCLAWIAFSEAPLRPVPESLQEPPTALLYLSSP